MASWIYPLTKLWYCCRCSNCEFNCFISMIALRESIYSFSLALRRRSSVREKFLLSYSGIDVAWVSRLWGSPYSWSKNLKCPARRFKGGPSCDGLTSFFIVGRRFRMRGSISMIVFSSCKWCFCTRFFMYKLHIFRLSLYSYFSSRLLSMCKRDPSGMTVWLLPYKRNLVFSFAKFFVQLVLWLFIMSKMTGLLKSFPVSSLMLIIALAYISTLVETKFAFFVNSEVFCILSLIILLAY